MEPDSIKTWLQQFGNKLLGITSHRTNLIDEAGKVPSIQVGEFSPSLQVREKMADRMGTTEGGLAWALDGVVLRLADIHEALRQSLAAHLHTDLDGMKIIDRIHGALD